MPPLKRRLARNEGFTLVELLIVLVVVGTLLAIAVPSYLSFRDRANNSAAKANVRASIPAVEAYNADNSKGYSGMTLAKLTAYDQGVKNVSIVGTPNQTSYCLKSQVGTKSWYKKGPGGDNTPTAGTGP